MEPEPPIRDRVQLMNDILGSVGHLKHWMYQDRILSYRYTTPCKVPQLWMRMLQRWHFMPLSTAAGVWLKASTAAKRVKSCAISTPGIWGTDSTRRGLSGAFFSQTAVFLALFSTLMPLRLHGMGINSIPLSFTLLSTSCTTFAVKVVTVVWPFSPY